MTEEKPRRRRRRQITVAEVVEFLEYLAPPALASPPAPYGLQVGSALAPVKGIVVAPLPTYNAISCAAAYRAGLLITAAPLLTSPLATLRWDTPLGGKVAHLIQRHLSLYALSNAYAAAPGGFDDSLAERLGLGGTSILTQTAHEAQVKFVVFVPNDALDSVRTAAAEAGAGVIGNYAHCSYASDGTGTFLPREGAHPSVGTVGSLERVQETRLEMLVSERELKGVLAAVLDAHPYEEVAYDVYPLRNPGLTYGRGRTGELPLKVSLDTLLAQVSDTLGLSADNPPRVSHRPGLPVGSLAVASGTGAGEELLWAAQRREAGALVVGGASLADLMAVDSLPTVLIDVGFSPSVAPGLQRLVAQLHDTFHAEGVPVWYGG